MKRAAALVCIFFIDVVFAGCTAEAPPEVPGTPVARAQTAAVPSAVEAEKDRVSPGAHRPRVAILYFDYDGADAELASLRKGLAQMFIADALSSSAIEVVERARLQELLDELKLNESRVIDQASAVKVGALLGAQYLVLGGYFDVMGQFRVDARVVDVATSRVVCALGASSTRERFADLQKAISAALVPALASSGAECRAASPLPEATKKKPVKPASVARYSKALDAMDDKKPAEAARILKLVVKDEPDFVAAALDLAALEST